MSRLSIIRVKIYRTVARQLHGVVPCWICREQVLFEDATLEHIKPLVEGGSSHSENLAISHSWCNHGRHAKVATVTEQTEREIVNRRRWSVLAAACAATLAGR